MRRAGLRILMTADAVGGVWIYALALARALCERGSEVLLVVMGPQPDGQQVSALQGVRGLRLAVTDLQLEWLDPQGDDVPRARETLLRIADAFAPDVVHLNSFREATFAWPARVLVAAHSCVWTWWRACRGCAPDEARWHRYADSVAAGLAAADAWLAPTVAFRDDMAKTYRPPTEGVVIRNGLSVHPPMTPAITKQPVILAAGRLWDEAKNITALTALARDLPWPVRVAGAVRAPGAASGQTAADGVDYLGDLPNRELIEEMGRAAIFAAPALYEPFGLSVLEAATCGCALVLSDLPTFRELWGGAAWFVDPRDRHALRNALQTLCGDGKLRVRLQAAARARAQLYSLAAMAQAYRRLYGAMSAAPAAAAITPAASRPELRA